MKMYKTLKYTQKISAAMIAPQSTAAAQLTSLRRTRRRTGAPISQQIANAIGRPINAETSQSRGLKVVNICTATAAQPRRADRLMARENWVGCRSAFLAWPHQSSFMGMAA